jgi:hypothetical protein
LPRAARPARIDLDQKGSIPVTRLATARPAAPMPAPNSTTRSPGPAGVAAASSMASWPARWPDRG